MNKTTKTSVTRSISSTEKIKHLCCAAPAGTTLNIMAMVSGSLTSACETSTIEGMTMLTYTPPKAYCADTYTFTFS